MGLDSSSVLAVAIVTGGSTRAGGDVARVLASWVWPVVIVYLDRQAQVEATVEEIIGAGGSAVAVRADLADDLDVQRVFNESRVAFGGVDVVVHTTSEDPSLVYEHAARYVRRGGVIVSTAVTESIAPAVASTLHNRGITVTPVPLGGVVGTVEAWRRQSPG
jgi:NAD(P)-dependent dehydrogenase (short-subunit alcohol dehydrogenase family)